MSKKGHTSTTKGSGAARTSDTAGPDRTKTAILLVVLIGFLMLIVGKLVIGDSGPADTLTAGEPGEETITSVRNDAVADFEAAFGSDKPIYVLFHSLTCVPCVEISEVADVVVPEYEDEIAFVNAITDDPSGRELASGFSFQYIPTSFFLAPDGTVVDSFTGAMDETQMRGHLDALVSAQ